MVNHRIPLLLAFSRSPETEEELHYQAFHPVLDLDLWNSYQPSNIAYTTTSHPAAGNRKIKFTLQNSLSFELNFITCKTVSRRPARCIFMHNPAILVLSVSWGKEIPFVVFFPIHKSGYLYVTAYISFFPT